MSLFVNKSLPLQLSGPTMGAVFDFLAILDSKPLVEGSTEEILKNFFQELFASAEEMGAKSSIQFIGPNSYMDELANVLAILDSKPLVGASADEMVKNHSQEISASVEEMGAKLSFLEATALSIYYGMIYYKFSVCPSDYPEEVSNEIILHDSYSNQLPEYL